MRLRVLALVTAVVLFAAGMSGCGAINSVAQMISGDVTGKVGKTYSTDWFEFTVHSIDKVDSCEDYRPSDGYQLYDVLITEKNIFDESIPMGTYDFYMDDPSFEEYIWPMAPLDESMMPEEFDLPPGETVQYRMVYEVPDGVTELALMYTEYDEEDNEGNTFTIYIQPK